VTLFCMKKHFRYCFPRDPGSSYERGGPYHSLFIGDLLQSVWLVPPKEPNTNIFYFLPEDEKTIYGRFPTLPEAEEIFGNPSTRATVCNKPNFQGECMDLPSYFVKSPGEAEWRFKVKDLDFDIRSMIVRPWMPRHHRT
jgi:hypothetical protein